MEKKLTRSRTDCKIAGVCGGLAAFFNMDSTIIRLIVAVFTLCSVGTGVILYLIAALIIPVEPTNSGSQD